ncbi:murein biosynthesis integral membrane protein MurJ [Brevibacterium sp. BRM-1]|uniref:murein biosynthesis integral membrane protein MurJ n=1 Tax=Brevibacterium sp. BRM-1 TaxID=2999062 RepID=UPI002E159622
MAGTKIASLARSSAIMTAGTLVSRILGLVKTMMLALAIGVTAGGAADAFDVANKVPNNLYMLLAGGVLNAVLVPQIVRAAKQPDGGRDFTDRLLTLTVGLLFAFTAIATLFAPGFVHLYSSSTWSGEKTALAVAFAYWCLPQIFFYGLYTMLGQVLNAKSSFGPYMWAPVVNNLVSMAGLGAFILMFGPGRMGQHAVGTWDAQKITVLAGSATLGVVAQALVLLWPLYRIGFRYRPRFGFRGVGLGRAGKVAGWTFGAVLLGQLGFIITSRVASQASSNGAEVSASNAAYSVAYLIFMLPHSLVAVSLATALFTPLSSAAAEGDTPAVVRQFSTGTRLVGLVNMFFTAALIALAGPVAMVIGGGTTEQAIALGIIIVTMVLGLVPFSANYLLQRVFYAYEDARTPFFVQVPQVLITAAGVLVSSSLPPRLIVAGIGASMTLGYIVACALSAILLRRRIGTLGLRAIIGAHVRFAIAGIVASLAGTALLRLVGPEAWDTQVSALLTGTWIGIVILALYLGVCWVLGVTELRQLQATVRAKLKR